MQEVHRSFYLPLSAYAFDARAGIWIDKATRALRSRVTRKEVGLLKPMLPFFPKPPKQNHNNEWFVDASGNDVLEILDVFLPHLRLTKPLAEVAVEYQRWKNNHKKSRPYLPDEQETYAAFLQKMQDLRNNMYTVDIGEQPLSHQYLATLFHQGRGLSDFSRPYLIVQMGLNNRFFIERLKSEYGGGIYPKKSSEPRIWRVTGYKAEIFLGKITPLMDTQIGRLNKGFGG